MHTARKNGGKTNPPVGMPSKWSLGTSRCADNEIDTVELNNLCCPFGPSGMSQLCANREALPQAWVVVVYSESINMMLYIYTLLMAWRARRHGPDSNFLRCLPQNGSTSALRYMAWSKRTWLLPRYVQPAGVWEVPAITSRNSIPHWLGFWELPSVPSDIRLAPGWLHSQEFKSAVTCSVSPLEPLK